MEFTGERLILGKVDYELEVEHLNRYQFAQMLVKDKKVLDAACGTGYGSAILSKTAEQVLGIDISDEAILYAKDNFLEKNISFQVASVDALPFKDQSFDAVVSFETLEHINEKMQFKFIKEIKRVLTEDGLLIMSTPNHEIYKERGINHFHEKELELREFESLLKIKFNNVIILGQNFEVCNVIATENISPGHTTNRIIPEKSEYMIAVCSNQELPIIQSQVTIRQDDKYRSLLNWAIKNHQLNEQNNTRISQLDRAINESNEEVKNKEKEISQLHNQIDESNEEVKNKEKEISQLHNQINESNEKKKGNEKIISSLSNHIELLNQQILNKEGHIAQLLETDRELARIKSSRSWRYMVYVWKLRDAIFPKNSKRCLGLKMTIKCVKMPRRVIKMLSKSNIKKFFYYLKREGVSGVSRRIDDYIVKTDIQPQLLSITPVEPERIKDINEYEKLSFTRWDKPEVSIVIPVYNQFDYTYNCLKSILQNSGGVSYEIIIANDCSTDLTTRIEEVVSEIRVINNQTNLRFLKNCNNAAKYAEGKYVLFLNNDTQVQENWLEPLVTLMESDAKIGLVGSKLVYADGRLQEAGGIFWKDASAWNYGNRSEPNDPEYNYVKEVDYISGASIMISNKLWQEIGGFDEVFSPAYYEDSDLAFEVRNHGYKVMYQPKSVVVHFEGVSNGTDTSSGQKAYQVVNQKKFYEKWNEVLEKEHFPNGENVFLARDRGRYRKHILVVDHYVPHYDKDAGGKCTYMYIKLFVAMGMQVTFIGDNFFPHEPYTSELQQLGVDVLYGNYYFNNWKKWIHENGQYFDYIYLNRPHISIKYIDIIRENSRAKIIYFGHDLHYLREYRQYEIEKDPALFKSSNEWKKKEFYLFEKADVIYVVGTYEQDILIRQFQNKPVRNIPVYMYEGLKEKVNTDFSTRQDIIFVGGFGHTPNVDAVLWFANEVFPTVLEQNPEMKWYIVGSKPPEEVLALADEHIIVTGFVSDAELDDLYASCRMAVVPLRVGAGVKGKVVEAVYNRIPLITTSIGAEGLSLDEQAFIVADGALNMINTINEIYADFTCLEKLSENCKDFILNYFTEKIAREIVEMDITP